MWPGQPDVARATFRRGWVLTGTDEVPVGCSDWSRFRIAGDWYLHAHPDLEVATSVNADRGALLLGDPLDCRSGKAGVRSVHRGLERSNRASLQTAITRVHALSGRFVAMVWNNSELVLMPDPGGTMPFFWTDKGGSVTVGAWSHQVAEIADLEFNEEVPELLRYARDSGGMTTVFAPGNMTPFRDLLPVYPNHGLWLTRASSARPDHRRTYPNDTMELPISNEAAYEQFVEAFEENVRLAASLGPVAISLTGGLDSNSILSAAHDWMRPDSFCWTFHRFPPPNPNETKDLLAANERAFRLGLRHRVLGLGGSPSEVFQKAYDRTMGKAPQFPALAAAFFDDMPQGIVELHGVVAEVGTGFYKHRGVETFNARNLAGIYAKGEYAEDSRVVGAFEEFIDYADFEPQKFEGLDPYDLFYWEVRVGRWASRRLQEFDFSHRPISAFNDRKLLEALQVLARSDSYSKSALARYVAEKE